jgi:ketosteroid isomerase-like protein
MNKAEIIALVEQYFSAVDGEGFATLSATLTPDCVFSVETHGVELNGIDEIKPMFDKLWADHASVQHKDFVHVPDPDGNRVASRFQVINTHHDGTQVHKSNCNFFEIRGGQFSRVAVYMAGVNTLEGE